VIAGTVSAATAGPAPGPAPGKAPEKAPKAAEGAGHGAAAATGSPNASRFPLGDPDTVRAEDGRYVTYGTTVRAGRGQRCGGARGRLHVPVLVHGSGDAERNGMADCASGDALPGGPGSWAKSGPAVWAPGVARYRGHYVMYYTAVRKGSAGKRCIGRAVAKSARGPFRSAGLWSCPSGGRWALDANPFVNGRSLYVTYRDDGVAKGAETGISTVRTDSSGRAVRKTRRTALKSTDIGWETRKNRGASAHIVENPAMWRAADGRWYLMYSGNRWDSARYATGIARCGRSPLPASRCRPLQHGARRPYFGFRGAAGVHPFRGLPQNHRGPGGMDVFTGADGRPHVVWHWWNGGVRHPMTGVLTRGAGGFSVS